MTDKIVLHAYYGHDNNFDESNKVIEKLQTNKVFYSLNGNEYFKTATINDMIIYLSQFPCDMPLVATWEGTYHGINDNEVIMIDRVLDPCNVLIFEVEYK